MHKADYAKFAIMETTRQSAAENLRLGRVPRRSCLDALDIISATPEPSGFVEVTFRGLRVKARINGPLRKGHILGTRANLGGLIVRFDCRPHRDQLRDYAEHANRVMQAVSADRSVFPDRFA